MMNLRDNRGPNGMPGGFRRDERDMHQLQGQGQGLGGMNNSRGYLTGTATIVTTPSSSILLLLFLLTKL